MINTLVGMYHSGAITADHLAVESLHRLDPARPELVLAGLPGEVLERVLRYVHEYDPQGMRSNYGLAPAADQVEAARQWIEAKVEK